jgi:hypothetical protein
MNTRTVGSLAVITCALLASCARGPQSEEVVSQAQQVLSEAQIGCAIDVLFQGVGEGDSDSAYAIIRLETGAGSTHRFKDVEVLVSDWNSDRWKLQQAAATQLLEAAKELCKE